MTTVRPIIVFDADGVLLDYNKSYPGVYRKAFGKELALVQPDAYHATTAYGLDWEKGDPDFLHFLAHFTDEDWRAMPMFAGVSAACHTLVDAGYELICVTSMPVEFEAARLANLQAHGLPFERVIATGRTPGENPKLPFIQDLKPVAFVDDLARNFVGVDASVHKALISYNNPDSPNVAEDLAWVDSTHGSVEAFTAWWMAERHRAFA